MAGSGTPRRGPGSPNYKKPRGYSWPPITAEMNAERYTTHAAGSLNNIDDRHTPAPTRELASEMTRELLESPWCPVYLHWPQFAHEVMAWSRLEAKLARYNEWLDAMPIEDQATARKGGTQAPLEMGLGLERACQRARDKLGLTPVAWAKLRRELGLDKRDRDDAITSLGQQGDQIVAQRVLRAVEGGDGD